MQDETTQTTHNEPAGEATGGSAGDGPAQGEIGRDGTARHDAAVTLADAGSAWARYMDEYRAAAADHITVRHWPCFIDEIFSEHEGL